MVLVGVVVAGCWTVSSKISPCDLRKSVTFWFGILGVDLFANNMLVAGLRKKTAQPGLGGLEDQIKGSGQTDLFGSSDAIVKHVLEVSSIDANFGRVLTETVVIIGP